MVGSMDAARVNLRQAGHLVGLMVILGLASEVITIQP